LFRWFVRLSADDPVWDATVFCKNRDRLLDGDIAAKFFASVLNLPQVCSLLSNKHFSVDIVRPDLSMCGRLRPGVRSPCWLDFIIVRLSPHVWGGGVGLAAACHFVASLPDYPHRRNIVQPPLIEYDVGDNALLSTILKEPIIVENGACVLPKPPGLGVEL
jgi:L-alanine-DL-glutamate epimerase-like enolase superfamily enzyme